MLSQVSYALYVLLVTTRATSANMSDCFKRALKTLLIQWVGVLLQMTAPLS